MSELVDATHTSTGLDNRKLGMWLFLATEVMLFSALIGTMLQMKATRTCRRANDLLNVPADRSQHLRPDHLQHDRRARPWRRSRMATRRSCCATCC